MDHPPVNRSYSGLAMADESMLMHRADMRQARKSLKVLGTLCKEYGMGFKVPTSSVLAPRTCGRRARHSSASSSSSSSICECSSEDDKDVANECTKWETVKEMLDGLKTGKRVKALKDINKSMADSSNKAERQMRELDAMEARQAAEGAHQDPGDGSPYDASLLRFSARQTEAVQATKRCASKIPDLQRVAFERFKARQLAREKALVAAQQEAAAGTEQDGSSSASGGEDAEEPEQAGLVGEIDKRLKQLGGPSDADPTLQQVLDAQRDEIRTLARRIGASQEEVLRKRTALDYLDGRAIPEDIDQDLLNASISMVRDLRAQRVRQKCEATEKQLQEEKRERHVPSEAEVQEVLAECNQLAENMARATRMIRKMQEPGTPSPSQDHSDGEAESRAVTPMAPGEKRPTRLLTPQQQQHSLQPHPRIDVNLPPEKVAELQQDAIEEVERLQEVIAQKDRQIGGSMKLLQNAEQTLKTLEETKTIFLEHVARESPSLFAGLLPGFGEDGYESEPERASSRQSDLGDESGRDDLSEAGDAHAERQLRVLEEEERMLRKTLDNIAANVGDLAEDGGGVGPPPPLSADGKGQEQGDDTNEDNPLIHDIQNLTRRVREEKREHAQEEGSDAQLARQSAHDKLRALPADEVRELFGLRRKTAKLLESISKTQRDLDGLRKQNGNPADLLGADAADPDKAKVAEVRRKVRELNALRRRWWSDRQDPQTTVRRALAVVKLPESPNDDDKPPPSIHDSLFERIRSTWTLP